MIQAWLCRYCSQCWLLCHTASQEITDWALLSLMLVWSTRDCVIDILFFSPLLHQHYEHKCFAVLFCSGIFQQEHKAPVWSSTAPEPIWWSCLGILWDARCCLLMCSFLFDVYRCRFLIALALVHKFIKIAALSDLNIFTIYCMLKHM